MSQARSVCFSSSQSSSSSARERMWTSTPGKRTWFQQTKTKKTTKSVFSSCSMGDEGTKKNLANEQSHVKTSLSGPLVPIEI